MKINIHHLKTLFRNSIFYAGALVIFSFVRQIITLPLLAEHDQSVFIKVSIIILIIDFICNGPGASFSDYFTNKSVKGRHNLRIFAQLNQQSVAIFLFLPLFLIYGFEIEIAFTLSIYTWLNAKNMLQLKLSFNRDKFGVTYLYTTIRSAPYLSTYFFLSSENFIHTFSMLLLFSEALVFTLLRIWNRLLLAEHITAEPLNNDAPLDKRSLFFFFLSYILLGISTRTDVFLIEHFAHAIYAEYFQVISTIGFFVLPITYLFSSPLHSLLIRLPTNSFFKLRSTLLFVTVLTSAAITLIGKLTLPMVIDYLYPKNASYNQNEIYYLAILISILEYYVLRVFIVKYTNSKLFLASNFPPLIISMAIALVNPENSLAIAASFTISRALCYMIILILPTNARIYSA